MNSWQKQQYCTGHCQDGKCQPSQPPWENAYALCHHHIKPNYVHIILNCKANVCTWDHVGNTAFVLACCGAVTQMKKSQFSNNTYLLYWHGIVYGELSKMVFNMTEQEKMLTKKTRKYFPCMGDEQTISKFCSQWSAPSLTCQYTSVTSETFHPIYNICNLQHKSSASIIQKVKVVQLTKFEHQENYHCCIMVTNCPNWDILESF